MHIKREDELSDLFFTVPYPIKINWKTFFNALFYSINPMLQFIIKQIPVLPILHLQHRVGIKILIL